MKKTYTRFCVHGGALLFVLFFGFASWCNASTDIGAQIFNTSALDAIDDHGVRAPRPGKPLVGSPSFPAVHSIDLTGIEAQLCSLQHQLAECCNRLAFLIIEICGDGDFVINTQDLNEGACLLLEQMGSYQFVGPDIVITNPPEEDPNLIKVRGDCIHINMNGNKIDANFLVDFVFNVENVNNIVIENGTIINANKNAFYINNVENIVIKDITIVSSAEESILIQNSNNVYIENVTIIDSSDKSIAIDNSENIKINNTTIINSTDNAVDITNSNDVLIQNTVITIDSSVMVTTQIGINVVDTNDVLIEDTKVINHFDGYVFENCTNVICTNCLAKENNQNGFVYIGTSENILFIHCIAIDNTDNGFYFNAVNIIVKECCSNANGWGYFFDDDSAFASLYQSIATFNTIGIFVSDLAQNIDYFSSNFLNNTNIDINSTNATTTITNTNIVQHILAGNVITTINQSTFFGNQNFIINNPGVYVFEGDVTWTNNADYAIEINADNVLIDLGGHTIDGDNTGFGGIIINNATNVVIQHGTIINVVNNAITINDSRKIVVDDVCVENIANAGVDAIFVDNSENVFISHVQVINNSGGSCFFINNSSNVAIKNSKGTSNETDMFPKGIYSAVDCRFVRICDSYACSDPNNPLGVLLLGFAISGGNAIFISGCGGIGIVAGLAIFAAIGVQVTNVAMMSFPPLSDAAFKAFGAARDLVFSNCLAQGTQGAGGLGFLFDGINDFLCTACTGLDLGGTAFRLINCAGGTLLDCVGKRVQKAAFVTGCASCLFDGLLGQNTALQAFEFADTTGSTLKNLKSLSSGGNALEMRACTKMEMIANELQDAPLGLLMNTGTTQAHFTDLAVRQTTGRGIELQGVDQLTIDGAHIEQTAGLFGNALTNAHLKDLNIDLTNGTAIELLAASKVSIDDSSLLSADTGLFMDNGSVQTYLKDLVVRETTGRGIELQGVDQLTMNGGLLEQTAGLLGNELTNTYLRDLKVDLTTGTAVELLAASKVSLDDTSLLSADTGLFMGDGTTQTYLKNLTVRETTGKGVELQTVDKVTMDGALLEQTAGLLGTTATETFLTDLKINETTGTAVDITDSSNIGIDGAKVKHADCGFYFNGIIQQALRDLAAEDVVDAGMSMINIRDLDLDGFDGTHIGTTGLSVDGLDTGSLRNLKLDFLDQAVAMRSAFDTLVKSLQVEHAVDGVEIVDSQNVEIDGYDAFDIDNTALCVSNIDGLVCTDVEIHKASLGIDAADISNATWTGLTAEDLQKMAEFERASDLILSDLEGNHLEDGIEITDSQKVEVDDYDAFDVDNTAFCVSNIDGLVCNDFNIHGATLALDATDITNSTWNGLSAHDVDKMADLAGMNDAWMKDLLGSNNEEGIEINDSDNVEFDGYEAFNTTGSAFTADNVDNLVLQNFDIDNAGSGISVSNAADLLLSEAKAYNIDTTGLELADVAGAIMNHYEANNIDCALVLNACAEVIMDDVNVHSATSDAINIADSNNIALNHYDASDVGGNGITLDNVDCLIGKQWEMNNLDGYGIFGDDVTQADLEGLGIHDVTNDAINLIDSNNSSIKDFDITNGDNNGLAMENIETITIENGVVRRVAADAVKVNEGVELILRNIKMDHVDGSAVNGIGDILKLAIDQLEAEFVSGDAAIKLETAVDYIMQGMKISDIEADGIFIEDSVTGKIFNVDINNAGGFALRVTKSELASLDLSNITANNTAGGIQIIQN